MKGWMMGGRPKGKGERAKANEGPGTSDTILYLPVCIRAPVNNNNGVGMAE